MLRRSLAAAMVVWVGFAACARAELRLPFVFTDGAVLQRDMPLPVWGHADPGATVEVRFAGQAKSAVADGNGGWSLKLDPLPASADPREMTVTAGADSRTVRDLLVGEVWVCSGQSNMDKPIGVRRNQRPTVNYEAEIRAADYPQIRLLKIPATGDPEVVARSAWVHCTSASVEARQFSAIGYFFSRRIHRELNVPVGAIHTAWGGTHIEPWIPPETPGENPTTRGVNATPHALWNAMVKPVVPYAIRGALWYQGEGNVSAHDRIAYLGKMQALVGGWRKLWGEGDFPFYYAQLAPYNYGKNARDNNTADELPGVWEAQLKAMSAISNTGMAVTTDLVDKVDDIHPIQKREVADRLALWALAKIYGKTNLVFSGPIYRSAEFANGKATLHFDSVGSGLESRDGKLLDWFTIAGTDRKFVPANAVIEGDAIVVTSPAVADPKAVRFGWDEQAMPNLQNKEGLPASPFRTDTFDLTPARDPLPRPPVTRP